MDRLCALVSSWGFIAFAVTVEGRTTREQDIDLNSLCSFLESEERASKGMRVDWISNRKVLYILFLGYSHGLHCKVKLLNITFMNVLVVVLVQHCEVVKNMLVYLQYYYLWINSIISSEIWDGLIKSLIATSGFISQLHYICKLILILIYSKCVITQNFQITLKFKAVTCIT